MKRFCVYTAIVGNYDEIRQPMAIDGDFDFLLFSDTVGEKQLGVWKIMPIEYHNEVKTKVARWVKTHPEQLLSEYEYSVWIDANVLIRNDAFYSHVKELAEQNVMISTLVHPDWTCTYQEMLHLMYLGWESEQTTLEWGSYLRCEGFPRNIGTFETRVLYRNHAKKNVWAFDGLWWDCIERYSRRDQYSFRYCLWKESMECIGFLPNGFHVLDNQFFIVNKHNLSSNSKLADDGKKGWIMKYYFKHADKENEVGNIIFWIYGRVNYRLWWRLMGQVLRMKHLLMCVLGKGNIYMWQLENR